MTRLLLGFLLLLPLTASATSLTCDQTVSPTGTFTLQCSPVVTPAPAPSPSPAPVPPPPPATTGNWFVSPNGNDSNSGSSSSPFKTIQAALSKASSGQVIVLGDGTYVSSSIGVTKPVTIIAQNKWKAIISSTSGCNPAFSVNASNVTLQDLRISVSSSNVKCSTQSSANGAIRAWEQNTPNINQTNKSTGNVGFVARGLLVDASSMRDVGIKSNQDNSLIEGCEVHSSIEFFNNANSVARNNTVYGGDSWGDSFYGKGGVRNLQIYNNTVHMTDSQGRGLFLGGNSGNQWVYDPSTGYEAYDSVAYNNTLINETGDSNAPILGLVGTKNSTIRDNKSTTGGRIWLGPGGGSPSPMPVGSVITNNTGLAMP